MKVLYHQKRWTNETVWGFEKLKLIWLKLKSKRIIKKNNDNNNNQRHA